VRLWENVLWGNFANLRAQVCGLVIGNLTEAEWGRYATGLPYHTTCER
jgi:hypothetical protein